MTKIYINNLRGLDLLRFALSVCVIVWHYQHFFYPFIPFENRALFITQQPFYNILKPLYTEGYYAVQVFWLISGVIFYKVYQDRISSGQVTFSQFILNRFSRLYPLHILTLFAVIALQYFFVAKNGSYFIYDQNTIQSFFQNLLFVQSWGGNNSSFNGPTWSVSIEILVYCIFFVVCSSGIIRSTKGLIGTFLFFVVIKKWQLLFLGEDITSSIYLFFAGCILIKSFEAVQDRIPVQFGIAGMLFVCWIFTQHTPDAIKPIYEKITGFLYPNLLAISCFTVWTSLAIFNLKIFDKIPDTFFQFWGDMTYSTYLTHFPIQLCMYMIIDPQSYTAFFSPKIFLAYIIVVFVVGRIVFKYFEMPVQFKLRSVLSKPKK